MLRGSRQRILGVIALLAIAMQMVLLFAHTHVGASHLSGFDAASINCLDSTGTSCSAPAHIIRPITITITIEGRSCLPHLPRRKSSGGGCSPGGT